MNINKLGWGGQTNRLFVWGMPQVVTVRKHEVDIDGLKTLLRSHKTISNKRISEILQVPLTNVEHWFRTDKCFSIPDADIWYKLKELLNIQTDEFDKQVTEFEDKIGVYEKSGRCYLDYGIAPTVTCSDDVKIIQFKK